MGARWIGAIIAGSLFNGVLVVNARTGALTRDEVISKSYSVDEMTSEDIRRIPTKVFRKVNYGNTYQLIFENPRTRRAITSDQVGAVPSSYSDCMAMHKLSPKQCEGLRPRQLRGLGQTRKPLDLKKTGRLRTRLNPEQRRALEVAEARSVRTQKLFAMMQAGGNQNEMIGLAKQGISLCQENESRMNLFYAACLSGMFDLALYLLNHRNASHYFSDMNGRIVLLKLKDFLNKKISELDQEKIKDLMQAVHSCVLSRWWAKIKPLLKSPDKLSNYCKKIDAWLQSRGDWEECLPEFKENFVVNRGLRRRRFGGRKKFSGRDLRSPNRPMVALHNRV
jgi:hypothetical protein